MRDARTSLNVTILCRKNCQNWTADMSLIRSVEKEWYNIKNRLKQAYLSVEGN